MLSYYFDIHIILVFSNEMLSIEEKCFYEHFYPSRVHGDQLYTYMVILYCKHYKINMMTSPYGILFVVLIKKTKTLLVNKVKKLQNHV